MKLGKMLTGIGAIVCTSLLGTTLPIGPAQAQSTRPYIVLVNGYQNCCAWSVTDSLPQNAEIRAVPYSNFSDGGSSGNTSDDSAFLRDGADFINNQVDRNRPLILIGHSFGGDSVLKLLPRINRRIQFVAVIDPVRTGGFRSSLKVLNVPSNVDYFFNRWQENVPFPNDFGTNGSIPCNARTCDQDSQNIARNADFSPVTTECRWDEVTCPGFVAPNPFIGRKGRKGTKQVRVSHQDLPKDAFIQKDLGDKIQRLLAAYSPPKPQPAVTNPIPPVVAIAMQNTLLIRSFDGKEFGPVSSTQIVSGGDPFRGWSWNGTTASYITVDQTGRSTLTIRPFDGKEFGSVSSTQILSNGDPYRGWSWDGKTASYITVDQTGRSTLTVRLFDGENWGSVLSSQIASGGDPYRGWSWYKGQASYVVKTPRP